MKKIYVSYANDNYKELRERVICELRGNYEVIHSNYDLDVDQRGKWFAQELSECACYLIFMSKESVGKDSHCLNGLTFANLKGKKIIPIMLEDVFPPVSIINTPYVDMINITSNKNFLFKVAEIKKLIEAC